MHAEAPPIYKSLIHAYDQACDAARDRYEQETPRSQWVTGRTRWVTCEDLWGGPAPSHWNPGTPELLLCTACWKSLDAELTECGLCGRHDHKIGFASPARPGLPRIFNDDRYQSDKRYIC